MSEIERLPVPRDLSLNFGERVDLFSVAEEKSQTDFQIGLEEIARFMFPEGSPELELQRLEGQYSGRVADFYSGQEGRIYSPIDLGGEVSFYNRLASMGNAQAFVGERWLDFVVGLAEKKQLNQFFRDNYSKVEKPDAFNRKLKKYGKKYPIIILKEGE